MKKEFLSFLVPFLAVANVDLHSLHQFVTENTESLKIKKEEIYQSEQDLKKARGSLYPTLTYSYRWFRQDVPDQTSNFSSFRQEEQSTSQLQLNQPLFRGMAEYAGLSLANLQLKNSELSLAQEELLVFSRLSMAFYQYLSAQSEIENLNELLNNQKARVKELSGRSRIGRADPADLLSARAQATLTESDMLSAQLDLQTQREELMSLAPGLEFESLKDNLRLPAQIPSLSEFEGRLENRPDLQLAKLSLDGAHQNVRIARAGHYPSLDFQGNYYFIRPGVLQDVEWDMGLVFSLPLFEGGRVQAEVRKAASQEKKQNLLWSELQRKAKSELKKNFETFQVNYQRLKLLTGTLALSQKNYQRQKKNYSSGLISYLQVIQLEKEYWDIKRAFDKAEFALKRAWVELSTSVGDIP